MADFKGLCSLVLRITRHDTSPSAQDASHERADTAYPCNDLRCRALGAWRAFFAHAVHHALDLPPRGHSCRRKGTAHSRFPATLQAQRILLALSAQDASPEHANTAYPCNDLRCRTRKAWCTCFERSAHHASARRARRLFPNNSIPDCRNLQALALSAQGASHVRSGRECQDASQYWINQGLDQAIIAVSDGHGGDDYVRSGKGAAFACEAAIEEMRLFLEKPAGRRIGIEDLKRNIIQGWRSRIRDDYQKQALAIQQSLCRLELPEEAKDYPVLWESFTKEEISRLSQKARKRYNEGRIERAYGATLLCAAISKGHALILQIGDGRCDILQADGTFVQPMPVDADCFLNVTTSISDRTHLLDSDVPRNDSHFRHCTLAKAPAAIFLCTDGVDNSFIPGALAGFYGIFCREAAENGVQQTAQNLEEYLPALSTKGSGDDVSIAAVFCPDGLEALARKKLGPFREEKSAPEDGGAAENTPAAAQPDQPAYSTAASHAEKTAAPFISSAEQTTNASETNAAETAENSDTIAAGNAGSNVPDSGTCSIRGDSAKDTMPRHENRIQEKTVIALSKALDAPILWHDLESGSVKEGKMHD